MKSRREEAEERAWGRLYDQMDKNKIDREIREIKSILNGALGTITGQEAGEARAALNRLLARKKEDFNRCVAAEARQARERTPYTTGWSR